MTLHPARALAPKSRVHAVDPGPIATQWFEESTGQQGHEAPKAACKRSTPLRCACAAEDVAEDVAKAVMWLLDAAHTVTGEHVLPDSGMHRAGRRPWSRRLAERRNAAACWRRSLAQGQPGSLNDEMRVFQLKDPVCDRYSLVCQKVQSSTGSIDVWL